jgi:hypothetical protein
MEDMSSSHLSPKLINVHPKAERTESLVSFFFETVIFYVLSIKVGQCIEKEMVRFDNKPR